MTSNDLNAVTIDPTVITGGRLNSDCQTNIKSEFAISAETYLQFGLPFISMVTPLENSLNNVLNQTLEKWVFTNDIDRSTASFIEFFQEDPPEELGQSFQVSLRSEKAGRIEKLLGFARSHSITTRCSVSLSCATTSHLLAFLNLNGSKKKYNSYTLVTHRADKFTIL